MFSPRCFILLLTFVSLTGFAVPLVADPPSLSVLFTDDFQRNESQELSDEIGGGWSTNSRTRAGGNKQVDLRDGAMYIRMHPTADHAVSVVHDAAFRNGIVQLRFMLEDANDSLGLVTT